MTENMCLVCGSRAFKAIFSNTLLRCSKCAFVTANLEVDDALLRKTYTENYFRGEEYSDYVNDKAALQRNFYKRLKRLQHTIQSIHVSRALEIGCAYGFFGEALLKVFPKAKYLGLDVVKEAVEYARCQLGLDTQVGDFLEYQPSESFTDIFMWDVIEHLKSPHLVLEKVHRALEPEGRVCITTGDIGSRLARLQGQNWRMIHPPSHLHYFSQATLIQLLEKTGFEILDVSYPGITRSVKQIFYSLFILGKERRSWTDSVYKLLPDRLWVPINTFDIMFVIARTKKCP